jgi:NitT/TauT family transport system substrate-binding protein
MRGLPVARGQRAVRTRPKASHSFFLPAGLLVLLATACSVPAPSSPAGPGAEAADRQQTAAPSPVAAAATVAPPAPMPVRIAFAGQGSILVAWASYEGGYFARYGLRVDEFQSVQASPIAVQGLLAGELDVAVIGGDTPVQVNLASGNSELVMVANTPPSIGFYVYGRPEIATIEDIRGKALGANRPGTNTYFAAARFLRDQGMTPGRDVQIVAVGSSPSNLTALEIGQTQAGLLSAPSTLQGRRLGLRELADLSYIPFNTNGPIVRRALLTENRELVRRYLQATLEAIARLRQDKEFGKQVYAKWLDLPDDDLLEELYRVQRPAEIPWVTREGTLSILEDAVERYPAAATADPETFYDNSLLQELEASGFIARLYGR